MDLITNLLKYSWDRELIPPTVMFVIMGIIVIRVRPDEAKFVFHTLRLFLLSLAGLMLGGALAVGGFGNGATILREAFIFTAGVAVIRLVGKFLFGVVFNLLKLQPPRILEEILVILAYLFWVMVRLRTAGLDLGHLVTTSAVITAVLGLSMQDTLGNLLGGILLEMDGSLKVGDWIRVDDMEGRVVNIHWRAIHVETRNWELVVIPNALLMKSKFKVLGKREGQPLQWRRWIWFNVDYSYPPTRVLEVVNEAIGQFNIPDISKTPAPHCLLMDMNESGNCRYALRYWLSDLGVDDPTDSQVRTHVYAALQRSGIRLALPHQVMVVENSERQRTQRRMETIKQRAILLRKIDLFAPMTPEEITLLAERLVPAIFVSGDIITPQGRVGNWLYVLESGLVEVSVETPGQGKLVLGQLGEGEIFGEASLMTGEPRTATVTALTPVSSYRLDKESFETILLARPEIAEELTRIMLVRRGKGARLQADQAGEAPKPVTGAQYNELLAKIRNFFGIG